MKEQSISFDTAKLAKEKGFDWLCNGFYDLYDNPHNNEITYSSPDNWNLYKSFSAPTQSLLQKWLRDIHKIDIFITEGFHVVSKYKVYTNPSWGEFKELKTYEEALEVGLYQALLLL